MPSVRMLSPVQLAAPLTAALVPVMQSPLAESASVTLRCSM